MDVQPAPTNGVRVVRSRRSERPLLARLLQFYLYDFSEQEPPGSDALDFDKRGGFGRTAPHEDYWDRPDWHALLIRVAEKTAGFAFINTHSHRTAGSVEHNMAEFFVARKFRRHGVATDAVRQILELLPGHWEVAVKATNQAARAFWPLAIARAGITGVTLHDGDGTHWSGPIWAFSTAR